MTRHRWSNADRVENADPGTRPRLLLICDYRPREESTVVDHIEAIRRWSRSDVFVLPTHGDLPDELDLDAFDALVIHYSVVMSIDAYLSPLARWRIRTFRGTKAAFIQDEHRFVDRTVGAMRSLGLGVLFTCFPQDQVDLVYPKEALPELTRTVTVLTGYVPQKLLEREVPAYDERPIDVGYRARRLPPWLGRLAMEKAAIADRFAVDAPGFGLNVDLSTAEADRLFGEDWIGFLGHCKAMLGVESGASVVDVDGRIEPQVRAYLADHPGATFDQVHDRFLREAEGRIRMNQISPRCFEAAALGTLLVLYPGAYSGILEPGRHYVPLEKDHSNMADVVAAIRDPETWQRVTSQARAEVALNPAYAFEALVARMDDALELSRASDGSVSADAFDRVAERSYRRLASTRQWARGLPPRINRVLTAAGRVPRQLTPSPTAPVVGAAWTGERAHGTRQGIRYARALVYWTVRPGRLPWPLLARHRRPLLDDLGRLSSLQELGARARQTTGTSPYQAWLDESNGVVRIGAAPSVPAERTSHPPTFEHVRGVVIDLAEPWFAAPGVPTGQPIALSTLSAVCATRPEVGRRLLLGPAPWWSSPADPVRASEPRSPHPSPADG